MCQERLFQNGSRVKDTTSIDSIKEIASFFSVTIDELLSSEKILSIAENENKRNIQKICNLLFGIVDIFALMLTILPLYPNTVDGHIYSVNLFAYIEISSLNLAICWTIYLTLVVVGTLKIVLTQAEFNKGQGFVIMLSMALGVAAVLFLILTRQVNATIFIFGLLVIKGLRQAVTAIWQHSIYFPRTTKSQLFYDWLTLFLYHITKPNCSALRFPANLSKSPSVRCISI